MIKKLQNFEITFNCNADRIETRLNELKELMTHSTLGYVYALHHKGQTKIGFSRKPHKRMKDLTTSTGMRNFLFHCFETYDAFNVEQAIHANLDSVRIHGSEWFNISYIEAIEAIKDMIKPIPENINDIINESKIKKENNRKKFSEFLETLKGSSNAIIDDSEKRRYKTHQEHADAYGFCIYQGGDGSHYFYTCDKNVGSYETLAEAIMPMITIEMMEADFDYTEISEYCFGYSQEELIESINHCRISFAAQHLYKNKEQILSDFDVLIEQYTLLKSDFKAIFDSLDRSPLPLNRPDQTR